MGELVQDDERVETLVAAQRRVEGRLTELALAGLRLAATRVEEEVGVAGARALRGHGDRAELVLAVGGVEQQLRRPPERLLPLRDPAGDGGVLQRDGEIETATVEMPRTHCLSPFRQWLRRIRSASILTVVRISNSSGTQFCVWFRVVAVPGPADPVSSRLVASRRTGPGRRITASTTIQIPSGPAGRLRPPATPDPPEPPEPEPGTRAGEQTPPRPWSCGMRGDPAGGARGDQRPPSVAHLNTALSAGMDGSGWPPRRPRGRADAAPRSGRPSRRALRPMPARLPHTSACRRDTAYDTK